MDGAPAGRPLQAPGPSPRCPLARALLGRAPAPPRCLLHRSPHLVVALGKLALSLRALVLLLGFEQLLQPLLLLLPHVGVGPFLQGHRARGAGLVPSRAAGRGAGTPAHHTHTRPPAHREWRSHMHGPSSCMALTLARSRCTPRIWFLIEGSLVFLGLPLPLPGPPRRGLRPPFSGMPSDEREVTAERKHKRFHWGCLDTC